MSDTQTKTVRSAIAPLLGDARISASLTSQLLAGEVVSVMDGRGDWLQVRGIDGYEGWTHAGYLMPSSGGESTWCLSLGCVIRDVLGTVRQLPLGARIAPGAEVSSGAALDAALRDSQFPTNADALARSAESRFCTRANSQFARRQGAFLNWQACCSQNQFAAMLVSATRAGQLMVRPPIRIRILIWAATAKLRLSTMESSKTTTHFANNSLPWVLYFILKRTQKSPPTFSHTIWKNRLNSAATHPMLKPVCVSSN